MTLFTQQQQTGSKFKNDWSHSRPLGTVAGLLRGEGYVQMVKKQFFEKAITTYKFLKLLRIHGHTTSIDLPMIVVTVSVHSGVGMSD